MVLWLGFYILNENENDEHKVKGYHKVYTPLKVKLYDLLHHCALAITDVA